MNNLIFVKDNLIVLNCGSYLLSAHLSDLEAGECIVDIFCYSNTSENEMTDCGSKDNILTDKTSSRKCEKSIACLSVSEHGESIVVGTDCKQLMLWRTNPWTKLSSVELAKRPVACDFVKDLSAVVVADKTGDVYLYNIDSNKFCFGKSNEYCDTEGYQSGPSPILGHLSMLLDVLVTSDKSLILTCDRDEKIRVSKFPNSYNIETYCLSHTDFVTQLSFAAHDENLLLSGSGDGTMKLWDFRNGICLSTWDVRQSSILLEMQNKRRTPCDVESMEVETDEKEKAGSTDSVPAIAAFCVAQINDKESVICLLLDGVAAMVTVKASQNALSSLETIILMNVPVAVSWLSSSELLLWQHCNGGPLAVFGRNHCGTLFRVEKHGIIELGRRNSKLLAGGRESLLNISSLYKQRYDNVTDYLLKKNERIQKAFAPKDISPHKKTRWVKK